MSILKPVRSVSLKDRAVGAIRDAIFAGQLRPGDPLRELHLAKDLQVSQPTVREALLELERHGLVVRKANIETTVRNMTADEMRDLIELRLLLERTAAHKALSKMTAADLQQMERHLSTFSQAAAEADFAGAAHADLEFHKVYWQRSGNRALLQGLDCITTPVFAFVSIMRTAWRQDLAQAADEHKQILEALRHGNPAGIDSALESHMYNSYRGFLESGARDFREFLDHHQTNHPLRPMALGF
jgi:DNA-binding GntR family transcriptional regulator